MNTLRQKLTILPGILLLGLCAACKTPAPVALPPEPEPAPVLVLTPAPVSEQIPLKERGDDPQFNLVFDRIEAKSVDRVSLFYTLEAENPRAAVLPMEVRSWQVALNGTNPEISALTAIPQSVSAVPAGGGAAAPSRPARGTHFEAPPHDTGILGFRLDLELPVNTKNFNEYSADLQVAIRWEYEGDTHFDTDLSAAVVFPRIREPEFTITAIAISQAELINTRFRVDLRIDNPNFFPVDLSSLGYELYGTGRFWAEGKEQDILEVPAYGSAETRLLLVTNFIGMPRGLLDQVVAKGQVPYRFTGTALVSTGIPLLPEFHMDFSRSGVSVVVR
ncbi:hypothetical protein FACS1894106_3380 [Spirochaetia bacterium]|nr:hypothetical protein FACS1894106_3380 [Spirochaetia bacterium]